MKAFFIEKKESMLYNSCIRCLKWKWGLIMFNIKNRRYLGSKAKLLDFIENVIDNNCGKITSFFDVFSGTGNVAWRFNNEKTRVILNDLLRSNYYIYEAFFGKEDIDDAKIKKHIDLYNDYNGVEDNYFSVNYADTFFSLVNCRKIGFIRDDIDRLYNNQIINYREKCYLVSSLLYAMDRIANTVGHYDAYRANGDLNKKLVLEELEVANSIINDNNEIYCEDANILAKNVEADIAYIDPPYNSRQYCDAYHLLENVATWEKPPVYGTARKMDRSKLKSKYCLNNAPKQFDDLIQKLKVKYILVSYNNMGTKGAGRSQAKISDEDIILSLSKRGSVKIFETDFQQFSTGKTHIDNHKERLFLCTVGDFNSDFSDERELEDGLVKSPLNYTGGKYKLLPQLLEKFPNDISTFVDVFGGGFNVGANVNAQKIVYNDIQKEVVEIIKLFKKYNSYDICKKIDSIISKYGLSNTYENGYEYYKCNSDSGVGQFNKGKYEQLRNDYNNTSSKSDNKTFMLLTLIIYSFNNQIRFNSKGEYNMPVGKRDFNSNTRKNIKRFASRINKLDITFYNKSFSNIDLLKLDNPFVYCDPPYYLGIASYNESDGWNDEKEIELLKFLKKLDDFNIKFALSNVIEHKGRTHTMLKEWVEKNHFNLIYIKSNYSNSNYQIKNKGTVTREVLVTNY